MLPRRNCYYTAYDNTLRLQLLVSEKNCRHFMQVANCDTNIYTPTACPMMFRYGSMKKIVPVVTSHGKYVAIY